jgi:hypothetical protein
MTVELEEGEEEYYSRFIRITIGEEVALLFVGGKGQIGDSEPTPAQWKLARTMHAAPDLLAALEETAGLASVANEGDHWFAEQAGIDAEAVLDRARAAIANAKGEQDG